MSLWHCPEHGLTGPMGCCPKASLATITLPPEPNFIADLSADWCDRHERAFKMGERCPICLRADTGGKHG